MPDYSPIVSDRMVASGTHTPRTRWLLVLDEDGAVSLTDRDYHGGDGTPADEWHHRTLTYTFGGPGVLDTDLLRADLAEGGVLARLVDRVLAGHTIVWNGNNNTGRLDEDATAANEELERLIEGEFGGGELCRYIRDDLAVWDAAEWLEGGGTDDETILADAGLLPESDPWGEAVDEAATGLRAAAEAEGVCMTGDLRGYLRDLLGRVRAARAAERSNR